MGGGGDGGCGSTMEVFPKAYARGPSQLWLCSGTLLPTSCGPRRPALLTETSVLSGTICRVFSLLSSHSSPGFSSTSSPCRVGQLAGPPASLTSPLLLRVSPARCALQLVVYLAPRCRDLARAGPGGATRVCLPPPSCRVGRRQDPAAWKAEFPIYPRSSERVHADTWPSGSLKQYLFMVHACEVL
ncbi:interleukin-15 isoform X3 [Arvicola amphibius]|uniref:interleukin-15 isoform X3 n=1 Tax=Arvicola amphibius TaxID=1047088 RepID=UPI0018E2A282|nr:interleukin-15 isoform X3 [Arvicola amphibius]